MALRLRQAQVWQRGDEFLRIVHLERLKVSYKFFKSLANFKAGEGDLYHSSKKEFCRLLKSCTLLTSPPAGASFKPDEKTTR
jgi:hypothetical protein